MWIGNKNEVSDKGQNELDIEKQWVKICAALIQMIIDILPKHLSKV